MHHAGAMSKRIRYLQSRGAVAGRTVLDALEVLGLSEPTDSAAVMHPVDTNIFVWHRTGAGGSEACSLSRTNEIILCHVC
jgi:hypothetical protein